MKRLLVQLGANSPIEGKAICAQLFKCFAVSVIGLFSRETLGRLLAEMRQWSQGFTLHMGVEDEV